MPLGAKVLRDNFVTSAHVTGYKREEGSGAWVYVILLTWVDRTRFEIYRRYADFFTFQNTLLDLFPKEAGKFDRQDRQLPHLPTTDNVLKLFEKYFSPRRLESRLQTINYYCETILLKVDPSIAHCNFVLQFFTPQPGDAQLLALARPASLHPQNVPAGSHFKEYRVIAKFEAESAKQLSVCVGEVVQVIQKNDSGWWFICREDKNGWIPGAFLAPPLQNIEDFLDNPDEWQEEGEEGTGKGSYSLLYLAIADYNSGDPNQLSFNEGAEVRIVDRDDDGWWFGVAGSKSGWVPSTYLEPAVAGGEHPTPEQSNSPQDQLEAEGLADEEELYWVRRDYEVFCDDEISLTELTQVKVLSAKSSGWWTVEFEGKVGVAPSTHLSSVHPDNLTDDGNPIHVIQYCKSGSRIKRRTCRNRQPPPRASSVRKLSRKYNRTQYDQQEVIKSEQEVISPEQKILCTVLDIQSKAEKQDVVKDECELGKTDDAQQRQSVAPVQSSQTSPLKKMGKQVSMASSSEDVHFSLDYQLKRSSPILSKKPLWVKSELVLSKSVSMQASPRSPEGEMPRKKTSTTFSTPTGNHEIL